ncbi:MAG: pirin family protein [Planctomycetes bacterium]|nr:pirin family protein [Planctomycetota bacterium]
MITVRKAADRGRTELDWLDSWHGFSFGEYHDPRHMGFSALRVVNEDIVAPSTGFGTHGHRDMEILTWIVDGALTHRDSMGNASTIRPGDVQLMSAGSGVTHSEWNGDPETPVHLLQIWILPRARGTRPTYQERRLEPGVLDGGFTLLASPDGRDGSLVIGQDATVSAARLAAGAVVEQSFASGRSAWLQVVRGRVALDGQELSAGDAAGVTDPGTLALTALEPSEVLLFDLP